MEKYEPAEMKVIVFDSEDVITASKDAETPTVPAETES